MSKMYSHGQALQERMLCGINKLANNVAATLGPRGRNVLLFKEGLPPVITKDGVTVANFINFDDPFENAAAEVLKQASFETNNLAGDGTTTSTVLAREILNSAQKYVTSGASPVELKRGMDKALEAIVERLTRLAEQVSSFEEIENIATISANNDSSIGKLIATAADRVGQDGAITIEESKSLETCLDVVEGFRFDSGYFSRSFVTDEKRNLVEYENCLVLVTDFKIDTVQDILPVLELVAREGKPLIVVAEEVEGQALAALIMNAVRGTMRVAAIKAPRYGQERRSIMQDLCLSVGANFVSRDSGSKLKDVKLVDLGSCSKVEIAKNATTIVGGQADWEAVEERIESLQSEIKQTEDMSECVTLQERVTRLNSGVAIIKVGAATEVELTEKKHRVEDALEAVKAAQEFGTVPGGGVALMNCLGIKVDLDNQDQEFGYSIIMDSLSAPLRQMAVNSGESPDIIEKQVLDKMTKHKRKNKDAICNDGWNFATGKPANLRDEGVIDPAKVTMTALKNAVSVASTLLTTNNAVVQLMEEKNER
jgi:chaperonin GroEL